MTDYTPSAAYEWRTSLPTEPPRRACCPDGATKHAELCNPAACHDDGCSVRRESRYEEHAPVHRGRPVSTTPRVRAYDPPHSQYHGVFRHANSGSFAAIKVAGKSRFLGYWSLTQEGEVAAARCYDQAAREMGRKRWLNFPQEVGG